MIKCLVVKAMNIQEINVITLAYLGDAVYELYVRDFLIKKGIAKVIDLQKEAIKFVSAKSQSNIVNYLIENNYLNEDELTIFKRGRNYKRESHPKNTDIITYKEATGFEALFGYLYLNNYQDRISYLLDIIFRRQYEKDS